MDALSCTQFPGIEKADLVVGIKAAVQNKRWISQNMPRLRAKYLHKYVAVDQGKVVASSEKQNDLFDQLRKRRVNLKVVVIEFVTDEGTIWIL